MFIKLLPGKKLLIAILVFVSFVFLPLSLAQELKNIELPAPRTNAGKPLMQALKERKSSRSFSSRQLPLQVLSELLWAANGINRPEKNGRTAPSENNMQEIGIYVALQSGLYFYEPLRHTLMPVIRQDIRALTGKQDFPAAAGLSLIYVADLSRSGENGDKAEFYAGCDTGFISQNVYLYCASEGLATVVIGWFDEQALSKAMNLRPEQKIILTQTIGYPG